MVFVPSLWKATAGRLVGSLGCAGYLALAAGVVILPVIGLVFGAPAMWRTAGVILALAAVAAASGMVAMVAGDFRAVRRLDLEPGGLALTRGWRRHLVPWDEVRAIAVEERWKLGRQIGVAVVVTAESGEIRCEADEHTPLGRQSADRVAEEFREIEVPVTTAKVVVKSHVTIEHWWTTAQVADFWDVPAEEVSELAVLWRVACADYLPRAALHRPDMAAHAIPVYDPDGVCEVADAVRGSNMRRP
ncbi:hypothetical protein GCM10010168_28650 [Actinoplanes ianthinogenes]|uniref:Uncharacterized protein n=1 Tax=Actinoplanes ianthinogenes TaxID=122358 RepID=A0ABM7LL58_9ACTN|nr:hypothetical protein [Actinoplanes ianthinogenes]BCJ40007.1 hypothetical protein Aiant_06640 [Actinoplanes ianthinogenes]GGR09624.1 hypothetical protein GCM10010168_28650 [Actinoplanes ianthinogenes]